MLTSLLINYCNQCVVFQLHMLLIKYIYMIFMAVTKLHCCMFKKSNKDSQINLFGGIPAESTYYLLRKRIHEHSRQKGEDLLGITFNQITRDQISEFNVHGKSIRMDSKFIGSNIAFYSRYEIIHQS
jgi:hypothetical protein